MISNELQQIVDKFKEQGDMAFLKEATQESIDTFENKFRARRRKCTCILGMSMTITLARLAWMRTMREPSGPAAKGALRPWSKSRASLPCLRGKEAMANTGHCEKCCAAFFGMTVSMQRRCIAWGRLYSALKI